ncbi:MAG: hypothetical protein ACTIOI_16805, partial [Pseudomonas helleri]
SFDLGYFYGRCAPGRSLARLVNCYGGCFLAAFVPCQRLQGVCDTTVGASLPRDLSNIKDRKQARSFTFKD